MSNSGDHEIMLLGQTPIYANLGTWLLTLLRRVGSSFTLRGTKSAQGGWVTKFPDSLIYITYRPLINRCNNTWMNSETFLKMFKICYSLHQCRLSIIISHSPMSCTDVFIMHWRAAFSNNSAQRNNKLDTVFTDNSKCSSPHMSTKLSDIRKQLMNDLASYSITLGRMNKRLDKTHLGTKSMLSF